MKHKKNESSFFSKAIAFLILGFILLPFFQIMVYIIIIAIVCIVAYFIFCIYQKNKIKDDTCYSKLPMENDEEAKRKQDYLFYSQFSKKNDSTPNVKKVVENNYDNSQTHTHSISFEFENTVESFDRIFFEAFSYSETLTTIESQNKFLYSFFEKIENSNIVSTDVSGRAKHAKEYVDYVQAMKKQFGFLSAKLTGFDDKTYYLFVDSAEAKDLVASMSGHEFEEYCANLLKLNGFSSVEITKASGDQGIDIIAYKHEIKYGIQCKLYSKPVGNSAVQEVYAGKDFYNCNVGVVLTNNTFTASAIELAEKVGIILWDGKFLKELRSHQIDKE